MTQVQQFQVCWQHLLHYTFWSVPFSHLHCVWWVLFCYNFLKDLLLQLLLAESYGCRLLSSQARTSHGALVAREPVKISQVYALVYSTCHWTVAKTLFSPNFTGWEPLPNGVEVHACLCSFAWSSLTILSCVRPRYSNCSLSCLSRYARISANSLLTLFCDSSYHLRTFSNTCKVFWRAVFSGWSPSESNADIFSRMEVVAFLAALAIDMQSHFWWAATTHLVQITSLWPTQYHSILSPLCLSHNGSQSGSL